LGHLGLLRDSFTLLLLSKVCWQFNNSTQQNHFAKLTVPQPVKKSRTFYGSQCFITAFTTARQLSLSRARSIPVSVFFFLNTYFNIILPSNPSLAFRSCQLTPIRACLIRATCPAHLIPAVQLMMLHPMQFHQHPTLENPQPMFLL